MSRRLTATLIGGSFGAVFVLAGARTPLGSSAALAFRILAVCGLIALYAASARVRRSRGRRDAPVSARAGERAPVFGQRYWIIVAAEVAALALGLGLLRVLGAPQPANVAWISLIVGLHFVAFAAAGVWERGIVRAASLLVVFGVAGLVLAATPNPAWARLVSGVMSGFTMLAGSLTVIGRAMRAGQQAVAVVRTATRRNSRQARPVTNEGR